MPSADSGMVRRDSMPAAMPSWIAAISVELVFSSGVSRMPPTAQIAMKKNAVPARKISSVFSRTNAVTRSIARIMAAPNERAFDQAAGHQARIDSPNRNLKIGAKHVFQPARLAGDVVGAEPFDVRARRAGEQRVNHECERNRCRKRQPTRQPAHYKASSHNAT